MDLIKESSSNWDFIEDISSLCAVAKSESICF